MKRIIAGMSVVAALVMFLVSTAAAEIPKTINLQSVVYDSDGNVTEADFVSVNVQIVDESGNVYFQEDHFDVPVVEGAMNLLIGESLGGIPSEALDPTQGRKFVDILVDGSNPYDILPLSSVPYALWADTAVGVVDGSIDGNSIKDGSIELRHLAGGFNLNEMGGTITDEQLPTNIVRQETFDLHLNSSTAHGATTIAMDAGGSFAAQLGGTVQIALETLYNSYAQEVANRQTAITNLNTQFTSSASSLQTQILSNDGDISNISTTVSNHTSSLSNHESRIGTLESNVSSLSTHESRIGTLESNVSSLTSTVSNHETRLDNIETGADSREEALGWGVVNASGQSLYGFNAGSASRLGGGSPYYSVNFASPASNDNVVVVLTTLGPKSVAADIEVQNANRNGFEVVCSYPNGAVYPTPMRANCDSGFHWLAFGSH